MSVCNCNTKSFLHLASCDSIEQRIRNPLDYIQKEANLNPGSIIFYVASTDEESVNTLKMFRTSIPESEWLYTVSAGTVGTITMNNTTEVTFLPENEAYVLLELPNSSCIFFEGTEMNKGLAGYLSVKTNKFVYVNPITKELA
jgi:hypothetical protein